MFFSNTIFSLVSSPHRGVLPPGADAPLAQSWGLLFFDLTLTLSYEERE